MIYFGYNSIVSFEGQVRDWVERRVTVLLYTKYLIANVWHLSIHAEVFVRGWIEVPGHLAEKTFDDAMIFYFSALRESFYLDFQANHKSSESIGLFADDKSETA